MKNFLAWIGIKQKLDAHEYQPPLTKEGDFWWCSVGENVGIEVGGKSSTFTRPVVIVKKFGRLGFLGIPTTTKERTGSWYVLFFHQGVRQIAMLNQTRVFSYKRLDRRIGALTDKDFKNVKEAYIRLFSE